MSNKYLVLGAVLALSSCASAFFLGWGSSEQRTPAPPQYYYHKRLLQGPLPAYTIAANERQQIPSVPVQVPLQAQLAPVPNIHNVQLVPCLCPVTPDYPYDNQAHQESVYVNAIPVQNIQQQQIQQQSTNP